MLLLASKCALWTNRQFLDRTACAISVGTNLCVCCCKNCTKERPSHCGQLYVGPWMWVCYYSVDKPASDKIIVQEYFIFQHVSILITVYCLCYSKRSRKFYLSSIKKSLALRHNLTNNTSPNYAPAPLARSARSNTAPGERDIHFKMKIHVVFSVK